MNERRLKKSVKHHMPKPAHGKHEVTAFVSGGIIGMLGQLLLRFYMNVLDMSPSDALTMVSVTVMLISSLLTGLGVYDKIAQKCGAGLFVPICGFANSLTSSALEGKSEGWIHGIGTAMFKLAGSVLTYGIVSAVIFASLRYIFFGGLI